ncbi:MAG: N-acetylmuramoyl-L-alanine amidase [Candidatus Riflebacteria bacterium]|nr:N-acetylmuramoyl-L-alanine amidase [Candidatus Riflebacteria bacterium]
MADMIKIKILFLFASLLLFTTSLHAQESSPGKGYVSARELASSLGVSYRWFPMQKMVILAKGTKMMRIIVDRREAVVDNEPVTLPSAPRMDGGNVMVPARSVIQVFSSGGVQQPKKAEEPSADDNPDEDDDSTAPKTEYTPKILKPVPPPANPPPAAPQILSPETKAVAVEDGTPTLLAVRHSKRDDETRVVLEFTGRVSQRMENLGSGKMKFRIEGCRNIIPTKRSNPVGREIKSIAFNSGADKNGLVVTVEKTKGTVDPVVETLSDPFRMVLTFKASPEVLAQLASKTATLTATSTGTSTSTSTSTATSDSATTATSALSSASTGTSTSSKTSIKTATATAAVEAVQEDPVMPAILANQEWKKEIPVEALSRSVFQGRTIIIDPGHGGRDAGAKLNGENKGADSISTEKELTLVVARKLKNILSQAGFNPVLIRNDDHEVPANARRAMVNSAMADLYVAIHLGASLDPDVEGTSCYYFSPLGFTFEADVKNRSIQVFNEWAQSYRFDLSRFLAGKISERMVKHLECSDRGCSALPLMPLNMLVIPGVVVEIAVATNRKDAVLLKNISFQEASARAIANGITDFFNSLKLND